jgi:outer membrane lipoprotein SlyB
LAQLLLEETRRQSRLRECQEIQEMTMWIRKRSIAVAGSVLLSLGACGTTGNYAGMPESTSSVPSASNTVSGRGVVQAIDMVPREEAGIGGIGVGTLAGAAVGGILGNQVGQGRGNTAATVAGAAGGALVGHELEKNAKQRNPVYRVSVRMDNGTMQTVLVDTQPNVRVGDRIQIANGVIVQAY